MNHAVADAGPLIHLTEIGGLSLLRIFDRLSIADAVLMMQFIQQHSLERLQAGEQECLFLCQHIGVSVLLTDDLAVRSWIALRFVQASTLGNVVLFPDLPTRKSPPSLLQC